MQRKKVLVLFICWVTCPTIALADASTVYQKHLQAGIEAFNNHYFREAERNFKEAHLIFPFERQPIQYLGLLKKRQLVNEIIAARARVIALTMAQYGVKDAALSTAEHKRIAKVQLGRGVDNTLNAKRQVADPQPVKAEISGPSAQKPAPKQLTTKKSHAAGVIYLDDLAKTAGDKAEITIELGSSWQIEGKNIQKNLVVEEGIIAVDYINLNRLRIKAQRHGSTFLHVWDDVGRRTLLVSVVLPKRGGEEEAVPMAMIEHTKPLKFSYASDGSSYYYGKSVPDLERRSLGFVQYFGTEAETPYGIFDSSGTMQRGDRITHIPNYTVGMSNIPLTGTQDLDIRLFDSRRSLSPLTLPGAYLRGAFADVNLLADSLRLSATHGKYNQAVTSYDRGYSRSQDVYVDAGKLLLFPKDPDKYYALNYANSYGPNRRRDLSRNVYSVEGMHKVDEVVFKGELARNATDRSAVTTGLKWEHGALRSSLNFRDIDKNFTNVTVAPANQGEIGATWTADMDLERVGVNTSVDIYRDTLYFNPQDEQALNYDLRTHLRNAVGEKAWVDSNFNYVHTPGDISPRRHAGVYERLSRYFDIWQKRRATVFIGGSYQRSRYAYSDAAEFNRCSIITGVQIPIIDGLSCFANYEYSWVEELYSGMTLKPNVLNTGLTYNKNINQYLIGNWGLSYRNEGSVKGTNSFLTGEDSLSGSSGLTYNPTRDVSFFVDGRLRKVWPASKDNPSYEDLDFRFGMRATWGVPVHWDPSGIIEGSICLDQDGDSKCTAADKGLYGVKIKIGDKETITNENGIYRAHVHAKSVIVAPVLDTLPSGALFSTSPSVKVDISHRKTRNVDFVLKVSTGIYGVVFIDKNGNNIPDEGDQFTGRVKLILDGKMSQFSDNRGVYYFRNIMPGQHWLELDMKVLPDGLIPLIKIKSALNVAEGTTYVLHIPLQVQKQLQGN